jgi:hypothetical protein
MLEIALVSAENLRGIVNGAFTLRGSATADFEATMPLPAGGKTTFQSWRGGALRCCGQATLN